MNSGIYFLLSRCEGVQSEKLKSWSSNLFTDSLFSIFTIFWRLVIYSNGGLLGPKIRIIPFASSMKVENSNSIHLIPAIKKLSSLDGACQIQTASEWLLLA